ncbi:MAG: AcrB/AcrD/AcrF family protein [Limimaricola sp.]|uniref:efflux RND transporter permease subunit n=1 Tax=Limimaricola sp. TaxID=2211665 RepID=UPI001DD5CE58|nr:efflux RND transporter permease subunit [Limimaricola sp.]MBI1418604.1 AcrB/AcrD/AcrF family protein [Limimaricola sp.]
MKGFNLSDWALRHRSMVWYLILVSLLAGTLAYIGLGREEDPPFTIKTMVVTAALPGATAEETVTQVTDRIEKKLEELPSLDHTRSVTFPGRTLVYVDLRDTTPAPEVRATWTRVRQMMSDIRGQMPSEFAGFGFNDDFGDVFGNIYAFTSDGFTPREVQDRVEDIRAAVLQLKDAGKVDLIGTQDQQVHIEFSVRKLAALGLSERQVLDTLAKQNAIVPSGVVRTGEEQILVRVTGQFTSPAALADTNLRVGDTYFALSDVADVTPGYADPPSSLVRFDGKPALSLAIGMRPGGNILDFGEKLDTLMTGIAAKLPIGLEMHKVADQPKVVADSVDHFLKALVEAVVIVLAVSFISLGMRAGLVVTMTIPLVLALTFVFMQMMDIALQRISLGALIIALGLLVDDAMITIETMISRLEAGDGLKKAASHAWTSIAFPMLTGTLVTVAGFIPIGFNGSKAGEYTNSLFWVIASSLVLSWIVAVLFAPILGTTFLPRQLAHAHAGPGRLRRAFRRVLAGAMRAKWLTIAVTLVAFGGAVFGMKFVEQQFFPTSDRPELILDVTLRQNASIAATDAVMTKLDTFLASRSEAASWATYVGRSAPRFVLALDLGTPGPNAGQIVIVTPSLKDRDALKAAVEDFSKGLTGVEVFAKYLELGPPVGKPVQYRISGPDPAVLRDHARDLAALVAGDARLKDVTLDWNEPARVARVVLDQDKLRQLGLTQTDVARALNGLYDGLNVTELRDGRVLIDVLARGAGADRASLAGLQSLQLGNAAGVPIPLTSFASLEWTTEQPEIQQRDRVPTITVKAAISTDAQPDTIAKALAPKIADFAAALPAGYKLVTGGTVESSAQSQAPIIAVVPLMLLVMLTLVMVQVQGFRRMFVVLAVAPLGLIGVVAALVPSGAPLGFVAILGVLALVGILIRNAIILVHEIEVLREGGMGAWDAVLGASDSRARPILLTAAAASLALIPISQEVFWGPMAYAMMGGIIAGTLITLLFAPALYCAVFRVRPEPPGEADSPA